MELTDSFETLLRSFAPVFTTPSFATVRLLMTGWILSTRHRYITDLIVSSDSVGNGHFSDYHRFFSQAAWKIDGLWRLLAKLLVDCLTGKDAVIILSGDDTLCRRRGSGADCSTCCTRTIDPSLQQPLMQRHRPGKHSGFDLVQPTPVCGERSTESVIGSRTNALFMVRQGLPEWPQPPRRLGY